MVLENRVKELERQVSECKDRKDSVNAETEVPYELPENCLPPDAKPYTCGQCDAAFNHPSNITRHYKRFHEEAYLRKEYKDRTTSMLQQCTACLAIISFGKDSLARHNKICKMRVGGESKQIKVKRGL